MKQEKLNKIKEYFESNKGQSFFSVCADIKAEHNVSLFPEEPFKDADNTIQPWYVEIYDNDKNGIIEESTPTIFEFPLEDFV